MLINFPCSALAGIELVLDKLRAHRTSNEHDIILSISPDWVLIQRFQMVNTAQINRLDKHQFIHRSIPVVNTLLLAPCNNFLMNHSQPTVYVTLFSIYFVNLFKGKRAYSYDRRKQRHLEILLFFGYENSVISRSKFDSQTVCERVDIRNSINSRRQSFSLNPQTRRTCWKPYVRVTNDVSAKIKTRGSSFPALTSLTISTVRLFGNLLNLRHSQARLTDAYTRSTKLLLCDMETNDALLPETPFRLLSFYSSHSSWQNIFRSNNHAQSADLQFRLTNG